MKATIHQPEFLPWLGFFDRIKESDVFVILDDVGYQKNGFINRNKIKTKQGSEWMTVPVKDRSPNKKINEVLIDNEKPWRQKILSQLQEHYSHAPSFAKQYDVMEKTFKKSWEKITDLDTYLIKECLHFLGLKNEIKISSQMHLEGQGTERLVKICQALGADKYLSGPGGKEYMDLSLFEKAGIKVIFQEFSHPEYQQQFQSQGFLPGMSVIDFLFNSRGIIA